MRKIAFVVEYDGTGFHGFQYQPGLRTVQGVLEKAISTVENRDVRLEYASRTDTGVHALYQVISFVSNRDIPILRWFHIMRGLLPSDIRVWRVAYVPLDFHPQRTLHEKEYIYRLSLCPTSVFERNYVWWVRNVDIEKLRREIKLISGTHDFKYFSKKGAPRKNTVRTVDVSLTKEGKYVILSFRSSGFLYGMVRLIVGTLVDVATGRLPEGATRYVLNGNINMRGKSAPARGLILKEIRYNEIDIKWQEECESDEDNNT